MPGLPYKYDLEYKDKRDYGLKEGKSVTQGLIMMASPSSTYSASNSHPEKPRCQNKTQGELVSGEDGNNFPYENDLTTDRIYAYEGDRKILEFRL